jgi:histidine triad (HIT) family protein
MDDCIFCKIINGDIPSATVYENEEFKAILDRFPANEGHVLIMPKKHVSNVFEIDPETAGRLYTLAAKIAKVMKDTLGFENMNIIQNNGPVAGQTVSHFHVHLIPRYENDTVNTTWKQLELTDAQISAMKEKLSSQINI